MNLYAKISFDERLKAFIQANRRLETYNQIIIINVFKQIAVGFPFQTLRWARLQRKRTNISIPIVFSGHCLEANWLFHLNKKYDILNSKPSDNFCHSKYRLFKLFRVQKMICFRI